MKKLKRILKYFGDFEIYEDGVKLPLMIEIDGITCEI